MLPEVPLQLMYEFLDAIETGSNAPMREKAALIEAGNSRIERLKMVAGIYNLLESVGVTHEGLLNELQAEGIDPKNIDRCLRSEEVHLKRLRKQYEEENKGTGITAEWFEEVLMAASNHHKYKIGDDIKLSRFCKYYQELHKLTSKHG